MTRQGHGDQGRSWFVVQQVRRILHRRQAAVAASTFVRRSLRQMVRVQYRPFESACFALVVVARVDVELRGQLAADLFRDLPRRDAIVSLRSFFKRASLTTTRALQSGPLRWVLASR